MAERKNIDVAVFGSINADTTYQVQNLPDPGETVLGLGRLNAPGGKGANQAVSIAALGVEVDLIAAVGEDDAGRALIDSLTVKKVKTERIVCLPDELTGSAIILVSSSGENSIIVHPGANAALTDEHVQDYLKQRKPKVILAQLEIPLTTALSACSNTDATVILNPAPMPERGDTLGQLIQSADILVPNQAELAALAGQAIPTTFDEVTACAKLLDFDGRLIVTLGSNGALIFPNGVRLDSIHVPASPVEAVDTSGAGDAFCGALAVGIIAGKDLFDATTYATEFASWTVTQLGAQVAEKPPNSLILNN